MFSNKVIRCRILDRKDQLVDAQNAQSQAIKEVPVLEAELAAIIAAARKKLDDHINAMEKRQKHIDYLGSTMDIHWIDNPPY